MLLTRLAIVEVKVIGNGDIVENGADLCVNEGQKLNEYRVSLAEGRKKKKEKSQFLTVCGSVGRRAFWTARLCVRIVFHM